MTGYCEREDNRIIVNWDGDFRAGLKVIKSVPGRRWLKDRPGRPWSVPLDMTVCRLLRKGFGEGREALQIGPELRSWAYEAAQAETRLGSISAGTSGVLEHLPYLLPTLYRALYLGPLGKQYTDNGGTSQELDVAASVFSTMCGAGVDYWDGTWGSYQTADVRFMADSAAPGNFNHQGLGKTPETIAEVWESQRHVGNHLVICPKGAVETVWGPELERWQADAALDNEVEIYLPTGTRVQRQKILDQFQVSTAPVKWVVVNPEMIRYEKDPINEGKVAYRAKPKEWYKACDCARLVDPHWHYTTRFPALGDTRWRTVVNDEVHKGNIRNQRSLTAKSVYDLHREKPIALSGTPMKKKGADIWGILHYLRPDVFTSFWNFVDMFFEVNDNGFGKVIGGLREDRQDEFFQYLMPYALRRTKAECAPWLPAKQHVDVWVELVGLQWAQYVSMLEESCAVVGKGTISASSVLAQYTRLQQFAGSLCDLDGDAVMPTLKSAKLDALWERLEEAGILDGSSEDSTAIFSQSKRMVDLVARTLTAKGVSVGIISGDNMKDRPALVGDFQAGKVKVLCVVTTAGGVALTLDRSDTAHFLDETWAPDDQEQAEDRFHRVSRMHQVTIYHYRAKDTIDEEKMVESDDKRTAQQHILDSRRKILASRT